MPEEVLEEVPDEVLEEVPDEVLVLSSEPVMPPSTPAVFISPITVLGLVQNRDVPGALTSGMAKHCRVCGHWPFDVSNFPLTQVAMSPLRQAVSWP